MAGLIAGALGAGYRGMKKGLGAIHRGAERGAEAYKERMAGAKGIWEDRGGDAEAATPVLSDRQFIRDFDVTDETQVAAAQQRMVDAGHDLKVDAQFGPNTEREWRKFVETTMAAEGQEAYRYGEEAPLEEAPVEIEDVIIQEMNREPVDFSRNMPGDLPAFDSRSGDIYRDVQRKSLRQNQSRFADERFQAGRAEEMVESQRAQASAGMVPRRRTPGQY